MKHPVLSVSAAAAIITLVGAGCPQKQNSQVNIPPVEQPAKPAAERGFGLLPAMAAPGTLGSPEAISARPTSAPVPPGMPEPMAGRMVAVNGGATEPAVAQNAPADAMIARPFPERQPATVTYEVTTSLPTWGEEGAVLRARLPALPTGSITTLAAASGLPSQAVGSNPNLTSVNFSWKDTEDLTWSYDTMGRSASFWKETDYRIMQPAQDQTQPPAMEDDEALRIARDFMTRRGFGAIAGGEAEVEKPYAATMPCAEPVPAPAADLVTTNVGGGSSAGSAGSATPTVAPEEANKMMIAPCGGWYSQQLTVAFTANLGSEPVYDMGGWPYRAANVQIDLATKQVVGGNVWMTPETDSSRYPLISADEALKRLKEGGRNPIYPYYGEEVKEVNVTVSSAKIGLIRYDAWTDGRTTTYFLPALIGEGTISYGTNQDAYRTVVPLVADEAFGGTDTGYGKPMPLDAAVRSNVVPTTNAVPPAATMPAPAEAPKPMQTR